MCRILNRVVSPLLVTAVLFVYIFNRYGTLALPGIPAGGNFGLFGESRFIDFFYFISFLLTLAGGFCCRLPPRLEIVRTAAGNNLMLRTAVVLQWWYIFSVLFTFFVRPFSFYFFLCLTALVFSSAATAFFYRRDKSGNLPIIGYAGSITFLNTLVFYLVCVYLYYPQIAQTGFIALYASGLYLPLFLSAFLFLRHSRFLSFYLVLLLAVPFMIILCTE